MGSSGPQEYRCAEGRFGRLMAFLDWGEANDHVSVATLRPDIPCGIFFSSFQFFQNGRFCVAALSGVSLDLPLSANVLRGIEIDRQVKTGARHFGVEWQETFRNHEVFGFEVHRAGEAPSVMVVDGFEDWLSHAKELQVLFHDIHIVALRVEWSEGHSFSFLTVVFVVIIDTKRTQAVRSECGDQAAREGALSCGAVPGNGKHGHMTASSGLTRALNGDGPVRHDAFPIEVRVQRFLRDGVVGAAGVKGVLGGMCKRLRCKAVSCVPH